MRSTISLAALLVTITAASRPDAFGHHFGLPFKMSFQSSRADRPEAFDRDAALGSNFGEALAVALPGQVRVRCRNETSARIAGDDT